MMNKSVEARGLTIRRGRKTVIDSLDLDVPKGAIVGLLGPSGSGKTTLMRAIVGSRSSQADGSKCWADPPDRRSCATESAI
jgi:ABC-type transporter Mla maintaining outer membrane lipid asymmetry ATPase subunit MlaF